MFLVLSFNNNSFNKCIDKYPRAPVIKTLDKSKSTFLLIILTSEMLFSNIEIL